MLNAVVFRRLAAIFFLLFAGSTTFAQFSPDSPVGIGAGLAKLFGTNSGFSAKADVQVLDASKKETLRAPMGFAFLDGNMRMDVDMAQMKGQTVPPALVAVLKEGGLDRVVSVIRLDRKVICVAFPGAKSYVNMELSKTDAETAAKNLQIQRTALGNETVDGHACTKNKVVVKNAKGETLLQATTWNATDLKEFPVQIAMPAKDTTTVLKFQKIQMIRPAASQFEPPAGYKKFADTESLLLSASQKINRAQSSSNAPSKKAAPKKAGTK